MAGISRIQNPIKRKPITPRRSVRRRRAGVLTRLALGAVTAFGGTAQLQLTGCAAGTRLEWVPKATTYFDWWYPPYTIVYRGLAFTTPESRNDPDFPLHSAVFAGDLADVRHFIRKGNNLNLRDSMRDNITPLHVAVLADQRACLLELLRSGADPNVRNLRGETPTHVAAYLDNREAVLSLVRSGGETSLLDSQGASVDLIVTGLVPLPVVQRSQGPQLPQGWAGWSQVERITFEKAKEQGQRRNAEAVQRALGR